MQDQRLKFDPLDVNGHIKRVYGPDLALVTQIVQKSRKNGLPVLTRECAVAHCSNSALIQRLIFISNIFHDPY